MERDQLDASNVSEMSESAPMEVDEEVKVEEATEEEEKEVKEEAEEAKEEPKVEYKLEAEEEVKMEKDEVKTEEVKVECEDEPKTEIKTELTEANVKSPKSPPASDGKIVRGKSPMYDKILSKIGNIAGGDEENQESGADTQEIPKWRKCSKVEEEVFEGGGGGGGSVRRRGRREECEQHQLGQEPRLRRSGRRCFHRGSYHAA